MIRRLWMFSRHFAQTSWKWLMLIDFLASFRGWEKELLICFRRLSPEHFLSVSASLSPSIFWHLIPKHISSVSLLFVRLSISFLVLSIFCLTSILSLHLALNILILITLWLLRNGQGFISSRMEVPSVGLNFSTLQHFSLLLERGFFHVKRFLTH